MKNYFRLLKHHKSPVRFVIARLLMVSGFSRFLTIKQDGYRIRFHNSNAAMYRWIDPKENDADLTFFRDYLKPGDCVVDVGANIGETVLTASCTVTETGRVFAFEPHPRTFQFLEENLRLNGVRNVTSHNLALGDKVGVASFTNSKREDMNRIGEDGSGIRVKLETLDRVVPQQCEIRLLKVDVEGYEKFVFSGGHDVLARTQCVYFEVSSGHFACFGYTTGDLLDLMVRSGFTLFRIVKAGKICRVDTDFDTDHFLNLIGIRDIGDFQGRSGWTANNPEARSH